MAHAGVTARQGCCGVLHAHNGELERGRELALALGHELPGTILTIKVSDAELGTVQIDHHPFHPEWNDTIKPRR